MIKLLQRIIETIPKDTEGKPKYPTFVKYIGFSNPNNFNAGSYMSYVYNENPNLCEWVGRDTITELPAVLVSVISQSVSTNLDKITYNLKLSILENQTINQKQVDVQLQIMYNLVLSWAKNFEFVGTINLETDYNQIGNETVFVSVQIQTVLPLDNCCL